MKRSSSLNLDSDILGQLDLKVDYIVWQTELGNFRAGKSTDKLVLFIDGDIGVAKTGQERGT